jgi:hypothetical protein
VVAVADESTACGGPPADSDAIGLRSFISSSSSSSSTSMLVDDDDGSFSSIFCFCITGSTRARAKDGFPVMPMDDVVVVVAVVSGPLLGRDGNLGAIGLGSFDVVVGSFNETAVETAAAVFLAMGKPRLRRPKVGFLGGTTIPGGRCGTPGTAAPPADKPVFGATTPSVWSPCGGLLVVQLVAVVGNDTVVATVVV